MSNTCFINFKGNFISHILFLSVHLHISKQNTALIWSKHRVRIIYDSHIPYGTVSQEIMYTWSELQLLIFFIIIHFSEVVINVPR